MTREPDEGCGDADPADGTGTTGAAGTAGASGSTPHDDFEQIVASWRAEGSVPAWPDTPPETEDVPPPPVHRPGPDESDDDHYHPPEPPPLPRPGPPAVVGAGLIILGLVLVAVPETLGLSDLYGLPLGLLGIAAGLTWLVMRMWPSAEAEDPHDGDDDGAIL